MAEAVRTLPGRVAAWRERREADLPLGEYGTADPALPACRGWRDEGLRLEVEAANMLRPEDAHAPYVDALPGAGVGEAAQAVRDALLHHGVTGFVWLAREVNRQRKETGIQQFHLPRYGETIAAAEAITGPEGMPEDQRKVPDTWLQYHAESTRLCNEIRGWPGRADALLAGRPGPDAAPGAMKTWGQRAESLLAEARAMRADDSPHARHLGAMPAERKALAKAIGLLDGTLSANRAMETALALPRRVAAWRECRARDLPLDEHRTADPALPVCRAWRAEGQQLEVEAGNMAGAAHAPYLDAVPGAREGLAEAAEAVRDALRDDLVAGFAWLTREVVRRHRDTGIEAFHLPRYADTIAEAKAVSGLAGLPEDLREDLDRWLAYDAESTRLRNGIRGLPGRAEALLAGRPRPDAALGLRQEWGRRAASLLAEASAMRAAGSPHAPHLDAMLGEGKVLDEAIGTVEDIEHRHRHALPPRGTPIAIAALGHAADRETVHAVLDKLHAGRPDVYLLHYNTPGTLKHVDEWAERHSVRQVHFPLELGAHPAEEALSVRDRSILAARPSGVVELGEMNSTSLARLARNNGVPVETFDPKIHRIVPDRRDAAHRQSNVLKPDVTSDRPRTRSTGKGGGLSM